MKTIHFNTGAKYTAHGQRITATLHDDNVVTFYDHDRMIDGQFTIRNPALFGEAVVHGKYLRNETERSRRSWADGMQRGGCNAEYKP